MKGVVCFFYPRAVGEGIKYTQRVSKIKPYAIKIHFRFFLSHVKLAQQQEKDSFVEIYYQFHCGKRANVGTLPMTS